MPRADIVRECRVHRSGRLMQIEGAMDVPPAEVERVTWSVDLPIEERPWSIGLIVGPSGCGKSTIARELFGDRMVTGHDWPTDRSIIDGFPAAMTATQIADLLSRCGFSEPPAWRRPFRVLSTGQQFRVTVARALAESDGLTVIDEFTSVVDRQVAQVGSAAVAKAVRSRDGQRLVAVACHYDIIDWLQPDWLYEPDTGRFQWRALQRRPPIELEIRRVDPHAWEHFKAHHYLTASMHRSPHCYVAFAGDRPAVFIALLPHHLAHYGKGGWRISRIVTLPDYQGVGLGPAVMDAVAGMYLHYGTVRITTSARGFAHSLMRSPTWRMTRSPSQVRVGRTSSLHSRTSSADRLTAAFQFIGPMLPPWEDNANAGLKQAEQARPGQGWQRRARNRVRRARKPRA